MTLAPESVDSVKQIPSPARVDINHPPRPRRRRKEGVSLPHLPGGRRSCPARGPGAAGRLAGSEPAERRAHACSASLTSCAAHSSSQPPDTHARACTCSAASSPREPRDDTGAPPCARRYGCLARQANVGHLAERGLAALPSRLCCKPTVF